MIKGIAAPLCALMLALAPVSGQAHEAQAGALTIIHPAIPAVMSGAQAAAGYFTIVNAGDSADRLTAVEVDFATMAMLHASETDAGGVTRMVDVAAVEVPAGATVKFAPGGLHVMFMGLSAPIAEGVLLPGTLVFDHAGKVPVEFMVTTAGKAPDMSGHAMP
ncbi:copper chaperone PCu(A)C [Rhodobacter capsulatus]|uniref:Copper chaperone PCu(A)C n=1 Tax=Rhodobacter capsulatus TaxID=1061 RepID=A0A4U1JLD2_RHOCA|nr:copper chaperone PCu(A)C [Rhodobacter capsulatus]TKD13871.1 copper chaperone PCu(A)C [Rhodobacter capsulatus]